MATFTPPVAHDRPPILPDSRGAARRLFRYFPNRARYIIVFALSNGTYVQDTASDENSNTNVPYPWNPYDPSAPYATSYFVDFELKPPHQVVTTYAQDPYIVKIYTGPTYVSDTEAASLTAAGYGALIS